MVGGFERNYLPQRLVTDQPCQDANSREEFLGEDGEDAITVILRGSYCN